MSEPEISKIANPEILEVVPGFSHDQLEGWIPPLATEEEIRDFCRGKIAYFKIPQYIRFVDSFPMTVTKKVQKFLMREQEIRERGLEDVASEATA